MSRFAILAATLAAAVGGACAETGSPSNSANNMLTGPSAIAASRSGEAEVSAPAAKGGKAKIGGGASITLAMVADADADGVASHGDTVRFDVSTTATDPKVSLTCTQNGVVVYGAVTITSASSPMTLSSNAWQGGAADCTAKLYYIDVIKVMDLASMTFTASA
jgi:hypothetical protein